YNRCRPTHAWSVSICGLYMRVRNYASIRLCIARLSCGSSTVTYIVAVIFSPEWWVSVVFFFFQAEDGIRDFHVTGVQTCALPIYWIGEQNVPAGESTPPGFMTWAQLAECQASGLVDVESHAHRHTLVFTSRRLAGFATPRALATHDLFDWPMRRERGIECCGRPPLGTPIYESAPLLSAERRYLEPALPAIACRSLVEAEGGARFFAKRSALAELKSAFAAAAGRVHGEEVPAHELRKEIETELSLAVDTFRRELGRTPRYFAYPWSLGSR